MNSWNFPCHRKPGFALVELLVVFAILSMLAAILFPVFAQAREKSRQASCQSDERQIGLALLQYTQDADERFPNGVNPGQYWFWAGEGWAGQCSPYLRSPALLHCPDDPTLSAFPINAAVSYGYNINLVEPAPDIIPAPDNDGYYAEIPPPGLALSALTAPSQSVALFEVAGVTANVSDLSEGAAPGGTTGSYLSASGNGLDHRLYAHLDESTGTDNRYATGYLGGRPTAEDGQFQPAFGRHANGSNFLLADGHVKWLHGANVSSGLNAAQETDPQARRWADFLPPARRPPLAFRRHSASDNPGAFLLPSPTFLTARCDTGKGRKPAAGSGEKAAAVTVWIWPKPWGAKDSDEGLVRAARRGDRRAFDALVHVYQRPLRGFLIRRVGPAAADDVLQETWMAAWASLPHFAGRSRFKAWLFGIALHKAMDCRRGWVSMEAGGERVEERASGGSDPFAAADLRHLVQTALRDLPQTQREVLELYYYGDLTMPEIAEALERNVNTVKYQFYQAHTQAARLLKECDLPRGEVRP